MSAANLDEAVMDCWNRIGVWGRGVERCPKLQTVVHCHNCELYSRAGQKLLQRSLSAAELHERATVLAAPSEVIADTGTRSSAVVFRVEAEWLAIATPLVHEITPPLPVHRVPHRSRGVLLGVAALRGELRPCVSLAALLGLQVEEQPGAAGLRRYARMLILGRAPQLYATRVDEVFGTWKFDVRQQEKLPATAALGRHPYSRALIAVDGRQVALLDEARLLNALARSIA